jgi:hypothetical protein
MIGIDISQTSLILSVLITTGLYGAAYLSFVPLLKHPRNRACQVWGPGRLLCQPFKKKGFISISFDPPSQWLPQWERNRLRGEIRTDIAIYRRAVSNGQPILERAISEEGFSNYRKRWLWGAATYRPANINGPIS